MRDWDRSPLSDDKINFIEQEMDRWECFVSKFFMFGVGAMLFLMGMSMGWVLWGTK